MRNWFRGKKKIFEELQHSRPFSKSIISTPSAGVGWFETYLSGVGFKFEP